MKTFGTPLQQAIGVVIALHGRGASASDILSLAPEIALPGLAFLAPEADQNSWYPYSFLAPIKQNEPWLTAALDKVKTTLQMALEAGLPTQRIVIAGFSQGACLSTEFVARNPVRYAALIAFTGGLIGPSDIDLTHPGDLKGMPALFCSGDPDPHVPWARVAESAKTFEKMGAVVTLKRYPGRPHTVSQEELETAKALIGQVLDTPRRQTMAS